MCNTRRKKVGLKKKVSISGEKVATQHKKANKHVEKVNYITFAVK